MSNAAVVAAAQRRLCRGGPSDLARRDRDQRRLVQLYQADAAVRPAVIEALTPLARAVQRMVRHRTEPHEDLSQVSIIGLIQAVERFDLERGTPFAAFAIPTIRGEITRHFRDTGWAVHVPRGVKDLAVRVRQVDHRSSGRDDASLAALLDVEMDEIAEARRALAGMYAAPPPDAATHDGSCSQALQALAGVEALADITRYGGVLTQLERDVIALCFAEDLTQAEAGRRLGLSPMQVSRIRRRALEKMRHQAEDVTVTRSALRVS